MSVQAITWAFSTKAPSTGAKLALVAIANAADEHGIAFPGHKGLAERCDCTRETMTARIKLLEEVGLVARLQRRRENGSRTSDWIVLAPVAAERAPMLDCPGSEHPKEVATLARVGDEERSREETSPDLSSREELGARHVKKTGGPPEPSEEPERQEDEADASSSSGGSSPNGSDPPPIEPPATDELHLPASEPSATLSSKPASERNNDPEYVRLADLLADLIAENRDGRRPKESEVVKWREPIRLMVERDGIASTPARALQFVEGAIRWSQEHHFWKANILSGDTLRRQYDQLEAQWRRERSTAKAAGNASVLADLEHGRAA